MLLRNNTDTISKFEKFDAFVTKATKWICFVLLMSLVLNISISISFRYIFHISFSFSEKLSVYLLLWFTFLGCTLAVKYQRNISVNTLVNVLPIRLQRIIGVFGHGVVNLFFLLMIYYSLIFVTQQRGVEPMVFYFKKAYFSSILPVSMILMLYQLNVDHIKRFFNKNR